MAKQERTIVKKVKNAVLYSDGTIRLDNVRESYPHIGTAYEAENDAGKTTKKYGCVFMLPKATHKEAEDLVKSVIEKLTKDNDAKVPTERWFLADGDNHENASYAGHYIVSTSESRRPTARKRSGEVITDAEEADDQFVGGYWANGLIRPWFFNGKAANGKTYPKRVCCGIVAIQHNREDETFGDGRINDEGVFDESEGGNDDFNGASDDDL